MAHYTSLSHTNLQTILADYAIEKLVSHSVLSGGSENTNYLVKTEAGTFVLTICEQKSEEEAKRLASLLLHLDLHNFDTSVLIKTKNGAFTSLWDKKPIMLKAYIEGDIIRDLPKNLFIYLGKELGKLHQIPPPDYLPRTLNYGIEHFEKVQLYAKDSSFSKWLKTVKSHIENHMSSELPRSLIHSDIFYNNIIVDKERNRATIMDFEEACYYFRVFDIGMMIIGTCSKDDVIRMSDVASLLEGYQQEISLLSIEIDALQAFTAYGAAATAFWRHQNYNHVNVDETMRDHFVAMKKLADQVISIPAKEFINCFKYD
ncbi:MAG: phosphotransferase [Bacteroidota bacterium]